MDPEIEEAFQEQVYWLAQYVDLSLDQIERCLSHPEDLSEECRKVWNVVNDTFIQLPRELRWEFALEWDVYTLSQLCDVSRIINVLCKDEEFWRAKFRRDLGRDLKYVGHEKESWKKNYILAFTYNAEEPIQDLSDLEVRLMAKNHKVKPKSLEALVNTFRFYELVQFRESMIPVALTGDEEEIRVENTVVSLDLSTENITDLFPEIGNLSSLQELDLNHNQLTTLPPEIGNLFSLQVLALFNNQLTTLPPEIGNLSSLQELHLFNNHLTTLPPEIGYLRNLQKLDLNHNELITLPPKIGNLSSLQEFDLSENRLTTLSPEIGNLSLLRILNLNGNNLTSLPSQIGHLSSLESLDLSNNQLTTLPPEIVLLTNLREKISLQSNPIAYIPPELRDIIRTD